MDKAEFDAKIYEMIGRVPEALKLECDRLWRSGGVDTTRFENDYRLPKVILTVALETLAYKYMPMSELDKKDIKNLRHF